MRKRILLSLFCGLVGLSAVVQADTPRYRVTKVTDGMATGINNRGEIVGQKGDGPSGKAFLWRRGKITILPQLKDTAFSHATEINDQGQVVGISSLKNRQRRYFLWGKGKTQDLGVTPWSSGSPRINNKGEILLPISSNGNLRSILRQNGRNKDLGRWWAMALNDSSQIIGTNSSASLDASDLLKNSRSMWPVAWRNGKTIKIGEPGGMGVHINKRGDMIIRQLSPDATEKLILLSNGKRIGITRHHQSKAVPADLNNKKQIVGSIRTDKGIRAAFWQSGQWFDLNNLIPKNSGWVLNGAQDINEKGQIAGYGTHNGVTCAFLLTPIN